MGRKSRDRNQMSRREQLYARKHSAYDKNCQTWVAKDTARAIHDSRQQKGEGSDKNNRRGSTIENGSAKKVILRQRAQELGEFRKHSLLPTRFRRYDSDSNNVNVQWAARVGTPRNDASIKALCGIIARCRELLSSVQAAQKGRRVTLTEHDSKGSPEITELQGNVTRMNEEFVNGGLVRISDVKKGMLAIFGPPGQLWTTQHPDGRSTRLQLIENTGRIQLLLKKPRISKTHTQAEREADDISFRAVSLPENPTDVSKHRSEARLKESRNKGGSVDGINTAGRRMSSSREDDIQDNMPVSVPRTTAASAFVYGFNAVQACLSAKRRKLYHLYLDKMNSGDRNREHIQKLAREAGVPTTSDASKVLLDRMSNKRPHNGVVLEASLVPAPPTFGLGKPDLGLGKMPVQLDRQSAEDLVVNGSPESLPILTETWRYPFILMLDGILDEGNMGNILRTAYFYGVDAVAVSKNTCASINSPIVAKASSGAIEALQILSLSAPSNFLYKSLRASWRAYAAVAPPAVIPANDIGKYLTHAKVANRSPLRDHPCILMLGAEGEGLRENLKNRADYFVSIEQGDRARLPGVVLPGIGVDSMNVSSAAGILLESFMRKPEGGPSLKAGGALGF